MPNHLYITNKNYSSWSLRPWLLLRELGIPFVEEFRPLISGSFSQPRTSHSPLTLTPLSFSGIPASSRMAPG
jgi:glutathione S-transferase